jgi:hypothetical protein
LLLFQEYNVFFYLWIFSCVISSLYAYTWDIKMDWGLMDSNPEENTLLREEIVYSSKNYYYFGILEDFILRFGWTVSVSLTHLGYNQGELLTTILAILEVFRRFVWNFFRLENEHLNNCGKLLLLIKHHLEVMLVTKFTTLLMSKWHFLEILYLIPKELKQLCGN